MRELERLPACGGPNEDERGRLANLVARHAPMVERAARSFARYGLDTDDLMQEAWLVLLCVAQRATHRVDDAAFADRARAAVSVGLTRFVLDAYGPVRVSRGRLRALAALLGRDGWPRTAASLCEPTPSREEELLRAETSALRERELERLLSSLGAQERAVIEALHLREEPPEVAVLARRLGIPEGQLPLVEARALGRMLARAHAHDAEARLLVRGRRVRLHEPPCPPKRRSRPQSPATMDEDSRHVAPASRARRVAGCIDQTARRFESARPSSARGVAINRQNAFSK